ncbi:MAG: hypothetical protein NT076_05040 [Candidatus Pacearchaeota archaeon]|nr:hypothetical protein [Candidatus Pacearchaeota archaeon]
MANPLGDFLSELVSVKGVLEMIVIAILVFVLFAVTGALKQTSPDNQEINKTLTSIEENTTSGISWYLIITGVVGTITLIFLGYKAVVWVMEQLGYGSSYYAI